MAKKRSEGITKMAINILGVTKQVCFRVFGVNTDNELKEQDTRRFQSEERRAPGAGSPWAEKKQNVECEEFGLWTPPFIVGGPLLVPTLIFNYFFF